LNCSYPSYITNSKVDPSLSWESLKYSARLYAKSDLKNPLVSPVYGDLTGLPRTLIFVGSDELLLDDAAVLTTRLRVSGVDCQTHIEQGMWHVYVLFGIPEAKQALNKIKAFLK
ncbi:MAG: alpha/beta hydrolase, partial [Ruminococcaceae bacterium]|nr:alpha/beta hydrolase [Oscillospiraceae bacterium]